MSQKKLIKLIYYLNNEESTVSFSPDNKLSVLKTLINLTQRINLDSYEIFYGKRRISWDEDKILKEYIGKDSVPVFYMIKKEFTLQNKKQLSTIYNNDNSSYNSNRNSYDLNLSNQINSINNNKSIAICKVSIDFFPSRAEIYNMLDSFLELNNHKKEYETSNKGTGVEITFNNSDVAYEFVKYINYEKFSNPLYKKIRTNLVFDSKLRGSQPSRGNQSPTSRNQIDERKQYLNHSGSYNKKNKLDSDYLNSSKLINEPLNKAGIIYPTENNRLIKVSNSRSLNQKSKNFLYRIKNRSPRTSSPTLSENSSEYQAYLKNKEKWIVKKGIFPVLGKVKPNFIQKGVNYDIPYGKPAKNHNFRDYYGNEIIYNDNKYLKN